MEPLVEYIVEESDGEDEYWGEFVIVRRMDRTVVALFYVSDDHWDQAHEYAQRFLRSVEVL